MTEHILPTAFLPDRLTRWTVRLARKSVPRARRLHRWARGRGWYPWVVNALLLLLVVWFAKQEMRSSLLQSAQFAQEAKEITYAIKPGASGKIQFPSGGPYDERLGYTQLPAFIAALGRQHFEIVEQARQSPILSQFAASHGYALYREKQHAGLVLRDRDGPAIYSASYPERSYESFRSIPPLVVNSLLFIEDRDLLNTDYPHYNPAVDWPRFLHAIAGVTLGWLDPHLKAGGASTLATQTEKFRHSPEGRTQGVFEKLRQMAAATLRAYLDGVDTTSARQQIVATYLDSTPLSSRSGYGEIIGIGDGLRVWYGTDFAEANRLLAKPTANASADDLARKGEIYKQVLSLLLAERRPAHYLAADHHALEALTNRYLRGLAARRIIDTKLRDAALNAELRFSEQAPAPAPVSFIGLKGADAIRTELLRSLRVPNLYALDHLDLSVATTIDAPAQRRVGDFLTRLRDPDQIESLGLMGKDLLGGGDPANVTYSVVLYERSADRNFVRVHSDSLDEPFDLNSGAKLQLGSTAKLRTLITYLDIVDKLHARYAGLSPRALATLSHQAGDPLTQWATDYLAHTQDRGLQPMLEAAMQRKYSASPGEAFFTGGGMHVFHNFVKWEDHAKPTVEDALAHSINLAFVRILRDIERFTIADGKMKVGDDDPDRAKLLKRFADQEGRTYLNKFYAELRNRSPDQRLALLAARTGPYARRLTIIFRSIRPHAGLEDLRAFLVHVTHNRLKLEAPLDELYAKYAPDRFSLEDRGYLTRVHPLEIWLAGYLEQHPHASRHEVVAASFARRQEVYGWLFKTHNPRKQDSRIRILVEQDAFKKIAEDWHRQGYPFERLVPSLATAIGSSGDRPDALADLMGIILNNGLRQPTIDITHLQFAAGTPYETDMAAAHTTPERVLAPEIAATVRHALTDVVVEGTGKRFQNAYLAPDGTSLPVGGKTGTGDNRFDSFAGGHRLIESRVVDRTATFVFFLGDRFYGTITAYVPGPAAAKFHFTSALVVQLLKTLQPEIQPLLDRGYRVADR